MEIGGDICTLEEALRQFTHTETLDGENKYHCSRLVDSVCFIGMPLFLYFITPLYYCKRSRTSSICIFTFHLKVP